MPETSSRRRILHLDGNRKTHALVKALAEKACPDCDIVTVESGAQALKMLEREPFDVVIVDPWTPKVTGFTICRYLADNKPAVPVFFLAHRETMNGRKLAEAAGSTAFFMDHESDQLTERIREALK